MVSNKKLRIEIKVVIILLVVALCICGWLWLEYRKQQEYLREHSFMLEYLPERAVFSIEKWSSYFTLNKWMVFNLAMTESNGDQYAKSASSCMGYLQLAKSTADACKTRLYELIKWKKYNLFNTEINIASGCLHLANLKKYSDCSSERILIEKYNTGSYNYILGRRAPKHVKRYYINKTFFEVRFKKWNKE